MHPLTEKQKKSFELAKFILQTYRGCSEDHKDPSLSLAVVAGDLIADIQYTMSSVYDYPKWDVESVRMVALEALEFDHAKEQ